MKITVVGAKGEEVKPQTSTETVPAELIPDGWLLQQQIAQLFDLHTNEVSHYKDKIDTLINYAKSMTDDHSSEGLKWAVRDLSYRVGTPPLGEKMINYLALYAKLKTKKGELDKQIEKIEHTGGGSD